MSLAVELRGVTFGYRPGQRVLEEVDLRLAEGEFVAVAGPPPDSAGTGAAG